MVPAVLHARSAEVDTFSYDLCERRPDLSEPHRVAGHAPDIDLADGFDEAFEELGGDDLCGRVGDIDEHLTVANLDRVRANRLAAETGHASLVEFELPVVPGAGESLPFHLTLEEGVCLVRAAVVDGVHISRCAEQGDALVVVSEELSSADGEIVDADSWHPVIVRHWSSSLAVLDPTYNFKVG